MSSLIGMEIGELRLLLKETVSEAISELENSKNKTRLCGEAETRQLLGHISSVSLWKLGKTGKLLPVNRGALAGKGVHRKYRFGDIMTFINAKK